MTLVEFLLARIAEAESYASYLLQHDAGRTHWAPPWTATAPAHILARCAADRQIVGLASWTGDKKTVRDRLFGPAADEAFQQGIEAALRYLALPYADHPDYRQEWAP